MLWKWIENGDPGDPEQVERFPLGRLCSVFNVAQREGVRLPRGEASDCFDPLERPEAVIAGYRGGPTVHHDAEGASYVPEWDEVHLPPRGADTPDESGRTAVGARLACWPVGSVRRATPSGRRRGP